jgi:hypothetical protein
MTTAGNAVIASVNAITTGGITGTTLGVWHLFSGGVALNPPSFEAYSSATAQKRICTQRRRLGDEFV